MSDVETPETPPDQQLLSDERGARSSMRVLLLCVVTPVLVAMTLSEGAGVHEFQATVWTAWAGLASMLIVGCFGPRVAQYLAPQIGAALQAIGQAHRDPRQPSRLDDHRED